MHSQQNVEVRAERLPSQSAYTRKAKVTGVRQLEKRPYI